MLDEVEGATAHLQVDALTPALRSQIVRKRDRYERAVRRLIAEGARKGTLIAPDPALAARTMLGALNWTATWYRPDGAQRPSEIAVLVNAQGQYVVNRQPVAFRSVEQLADELRRAGGGSAREPVVVISADAAATHQAVVRVMEAARKAGLGQITFTAQSK